MVSGLELSREADAFNFDTHQTPVWRVNCPVRRKAPGKWAIGKCLAGADGRAVEDAIPIHAGGGHHENAILVEISQLRPLSNPNKRRSGLRTRGPKPDRLPAARALTCFTLHSAIGR